MTSRLSDRSRLLARAFTRPVVKALASTAPLEKILDTWMNCGIVTQSRSRTYVGDLLNSVWDELCSSYRCEYIYKNSLASKLIFQRHRPHTAAFLSEFAVGKSIADVVVINGTTTAYELKTKFDSGRRLETQTADYLKVFDRVYVVAHESLTNRIYPTLSERVGLISIDDSGSMETLRSAESNIDKIDSLSVFRCLRKDEYLSALMKETGSTPRVPNGLVNATSAKIFSRLPTAAAHKHLVHSLKARTTDPATVEYMHALPHSMRAAGYATPLTQREREILLSRMSSLCNFRLTPG